MKIMSYVTELVFIVQIRSRMKYMYSFTVRCMLMFRRVDIIYN